MTPLERELRALASSVDWFDEPDVASLVAARIAEERPRPARPRRLALVIAVALVGLLAALAVPPARTAIQPTRTTRIAAPRPSTRRAVVN